MALALLLGALLLVLMAVIPVAPAPASRPIRDHQPEVAPDAAPRVPRPRPPAARPPKPVVDLSTPEAARASQRAVYWWRRRHLGLRRAWVWWPARWGTYRKTDT